MKKKTFKILNSVSNFDFKKNFILSGMNLAFLGYYSKRDILPQKNLYNWPDGVFIKKIVNLKKLPGRVLLNKIKLNNNIKSIKIIGNITSHSKKFLKKKFKLKINHIQLPYAPLKELVKKKIIVKNSEIIFITLPTPKQEQLAFSIAKKNKILKLFVLVVQSQSQVVKKNKFQKSLKILNFCGDCIMIFLEEFLDYLKVFIFI